MLLECSICGHLSDALHGPFHGHVLCEFCFDNMYNVVEDDSQEELSES